MAAGESFCIRLFTLKACLCLLDLIENALFLLLRKSESLFQSPVIDNIMLFQNIVHIVFDHCEVVRVLEVFISVVGSIAVDQISDIVGILICRDLHSVNGEDGLVCKNWALGVQQRKSQGRDNKNQYGSRTDAHPHFLRLADVFSWSRFLLLRLGSLCLFVLNSLFRLVFFLNG